MKHIATVQSLGGMIDLYMVGATMIGSFPGVGWVIYGSMPMNKDQYGNLYVLESASETWLEICKATGKLYKDKTVLKSTEPGSGFYMA